MTNLTRRKMLTYASLVPGSLLLTLSAGCSRQTEQTACSNPAEMDDSELSLRQSLSYIEISQDSEKTCAQCAYFHTAQAGSSCGNCQLLFDGAVSASGHCSSWSAKA